VLLCSTIGINSSCSFLFFTVTATKIYPNLDGGDDDHETIDIVSLKEKVEKYRLKQRQKGLEAQ